MKFFWVIVCLFMSLPSFSSELNQRIETYCQDLNVLHQRLMVITYNIANHQTTATPSGGPFYRKIVQSCKAGFCTIVRSIEPPYLKYLPKHPDADSLGYVKYPGFTVEEEKANLEKWQQVYEVVVANAPVPKGFFFKDPRAQKCFDKYPALASHYNYKDYLGR